MKKMNENILSDAKKRGGDATNSSNETASATSNATNETTSVTNTATPQDQMILMSMALVYLLSLPLVLVYFLYITLFSLKNASMKNRINNQNDVICFRSYIINE